MTEEFDPENPDLEDALDGLVAASKYCDEKGHNDLSHVIGHLYQRLGGLEMGDQETDYGDLRERVREIIDEDRELLNALDESDQNPGELLDWLCWSWATDGERFYPPDETAKECAEAVEKSGDKQALAWEEGYHSRAYTEAVERFDDLETRGFDPVERTERHIDDARSRGLDLSEIDWTWLEAARSGSEDTEQ